jgi:predicted CXXCH cytochrome family protein
VSRNPIRFAFTLARAPFPSRARQQAVSRAGIKRGVRLLLLFSAACMLAAADDKTDDSCLKCHDRANLESLRKNGRRGAPEVIPEDPKEREAFAEVVNASDPRRRKELAEAFLKAYPASWVLEPVYEVAAKANIAIGDFPAALDYGARSLRLLPENPFLLVALADVETRMGQFDAAARRAESALWYLDRFDRPSSIEAPAWPQVKAQMQSQAYYSVGRAAAADALAPGSVVRQQRLADAEKALQESLRLDPSARAAYLLGMVDLNAGRMNDGAAYLSLAAKPEGSIRAQALDALRRIYGDDAAAGERSFEEWVASLKPPAFSQLQPKPRAAQQSREYAGSAACAECHRAEHSNWQATGMGRMFRPYRSQDVIGDFTSGQTVPDDAGKPVARAVVRNGRHYMEIRDGNDWKSYPVDYLIGSKFQQAYATKLPGGEIQVFPLQYNVAHKSWVNYWEIKDPASSARTDVTRFHEVVPGATYQLECAVCHTSQQRFAGAAMEVKASSFREGGINCEMCHGPSAAHVAAKRQGQGYAKPYAKDPSAPPVDFRGISAAEYVAICAQCHLQTGLRDPEPSGALNYSETGDKFYRTLLSRPYVDYPRRGFYKDGRFRESVFIVESFVRSACFRKGGATCGNCHDPHPSDAASNPKSLKFGADSDRMCVDCHTKFKAQPEAHTHHPAASEAGRCVTCHMPRIMNALMFQARDHQIDDIPDAGMAERFGPQDSPNACLTCHKDRDATWMGQKLAAWRAP